MVSHVVKRQFAIAAKRNKKLWSPSQAGGLLAFNLGSANEGGKGLRPIGKHTIQPLSKLFLKTFDF